MMTTEVATTPRSIWSMNIAEAAIF